MNENTENINIAEEVDNKWEATLENEISYTPLVDIFENSEDFVLVANTPGVSKENIHIKLEENSLAIFAKTNYENDAEKKFILKENRSGNFYRKFNLSDSIDQSKILAAYEDGQLVVTLPKHERIKPKTITIK